MIKLYENGSALLTEYGAYLKENPYLSQWFFVDGPQITAPGRKSYALRAGTADAPLLCMRVEPYSAVLFGNSDAVEELLGYLLSEGYEISRFLTSDTIGERAVRFLHNSHGLIYQEALAMDIMEATEITEPSCGDVCIPVSEDLPGILDCLQRFITDCGLEDTVDETYQAATLSDFRILRKGGKIVSMAKLTRRDQAFDSVTCVYTCPEFRGQGFARKVVNTLKNEILSSGKTASLSVDKKNPISNRLYESLAFKRLFSQGEYRRT